LYGEDCQDRASGSNVGRVCPQGSWAHADKKSVVSAFRGHMLVDAALNAIVTAKALDACLPVLHAVVQENHLSREDAMAKDDFELREADQSQIAQNILVHVPGDIQQAL